MSTKFERTDSSCYYLQSCASAAMTKLPSETTFLSQPAEESTSSAALCPMQERLTKINSPPTCPCRRATMEQPPSQNDDFGESSLELGCSFLSNRSSLSEKNSCLLSVVVSVAIVGEMKSKDGRDSQPVLPCRRATMEMTPEQLLEFSQLQQESDKSHHSTSVLNQSLASFATLSIDSQPVQPSRRGTMEFLPMVGKAA